jgi:hypothetical protein
MRRKSNEWLVPFGQWLLGSAPLLENPDEILNRYRAALANANGGSVA